MGRTTYILSSTSLVLLDKDQKEPSYINEIKENIKPVFWNIVRENRDVNIAYSYDSIIIKYNKLDSPDTSEEEGDKFLNSFTYLSFPAIKEFFNILFTKFRADDYSENKNDKYIYFASEAIEPTIIKESMTGGEYVVIINVSNGIDKNKTVVYININITETTDDLTTYKYRYTFHPYKNLTLEKIFPYFSVTKENLISTLQSILSDTSKIVSIKKETNKDVYNISIFDGDNCPSIYKLFIYVDNVSIHKVDDLSVIFDLPLFERLSITSINHQFKLEIENYEHKLPLKGFFINNDIEDELYNDTDFQ